MLMAGLPAGIAWNEDRKGCWALTGEEQRHTDSGGCDRPGLAVEVGLLVILLIEENDMEKGKIIGIEENQPHLVAQCMCVNCLRRWIDVRPEDVWLKDLECPGCGKVGFVIQTGQPLPEDD